jgi:aryl-phospho-beta-D-glucosidase BglC (GH1 family)
MKKLLFVAVTWLMWTGCKDNSGNSTTGKVYKSPMEMVPDMMRGINLGNTLEPPLEGSWNNGPAKEYYFDDYVDAGFTTVRIPVRWDEHTTRSEPFTIDTEWMNRVEQVVDWALERDLFVILNAHHEDWLKQDFSLANQERFNNMWVQIGDRFKEKSQKLLFEIINEPFGLSVEQVDLLNARTLQTIRESNPDRVVIYSGNDYSGLNNMMEAQRLNDPNIMAYFHMYDPWDFAGLGNGTWGSENEREAIENSFNRAADFMDATGIPVMISEFGAVKSNDYNSRMRHYFTYVESAIRHNIMFQVWDDGGNFGVYFRDLRAWPEVKDILLYTYPDSPTNLSARKENGRIAVNWTNRSDEKHAILIQRRSPNATFRTIAELEQGVNSYRDKDIQNGASYDYRIIAVFEDGNDRYSYPYRVE